MAGQPDFSVQASIDASNFTSPTIKTSLILQQTTANYTIVWANPAAARTLTIPDPLGADTFAFLAAAQTFTNKTLTSPTINGTVATTGLTLPAITLGGTVLGNNQNIGTAVNAVNILYTAYIYGAGVYGQQNYIRWTNGPEIDVYTSNAAGTATRRLRVPGLTDTPALTWSANYHVGMKFGLAGTATGAFTIDGATSGVVTVTVAAAAGTWTMTLPTGVGTAGQRLTTDGAGVLSWAGGTGLFGDGSDGDVTLAENTTLTRDMYYGSLAVGAYTLKTAGFRVFVAGTLSGSGTIQNGASGQTAGAGGFYGAGGTGGVTGSGVGGSTANSPGGGNGGAGDGAGGTATQVPAAGGGFRDPWLISVGRHFPDNASPQALEGGAGGGGAAITGEGGGGGGVVGLFTRVSTFSGTVHSNGGDGGGGGNATGGGGGGVVFWIYTSRSGSPTIQVNGGAGASGGAAGSAGRAISLNI